MSKLLTKMTFGEKITALFRSKKVDKDNDKVNHFFHMKSYIVLKMD